MRYIKPKQQGVALIIVLLIVAIVSVLATEMGGRLQLQIKRASNIKDNNQAYWYAMGAEQYARKSIQKLMEEDGEVIHLEQPWNQEFIYPIEGGGIQAQLIDMQSCFNLNTLKVDTSGVGGTSLLAARKEAFMDLLDNTVPEIPSYNRDLVRDSLVDWLDTDNIPQDVGAEDSEYESRQFPYITANNYMVDKSELRLLNGVEMTWLRELLELACVLPNNNLFEINVNTVSEENAAVLAAATGLSLSDTNSVLASRDPEGFKDVASFLALPSIQALKLSSDKQKRFKVKTFHFILHTKAQYNDATFAMQTLFKVDPSNNVSIIRRDFSGF